MSWKLRYYFASLLLLLTSSTAIAEQCDFALGKEIFQKCIACHTHDSSGRHAAGPNLYRILDKPAGSSTGFPYSAAMQDFTQPWNKETLDHFLRQPMTAIPGTTMAFAGLAKKHQRTAVICYMARDGANQ